MRAKPPVALKEHRIGAILGFFFFNCRRQSRREKSTAFHSHESSFTLKSHFLLASFHFKAEIRRYTAWIHHFPNIQLLLCLHFLSHSCLSKTPMTLCCYAAVLFWENLGQLGRDAISRDLAGHIFDAEGGGGGKERQHAGINAVRFGGGGHFLRLKCFGKTRCEFEEEAQQCQRA